MNKNEIKRLCYTIGVNYKDFNMQEMLRGYKVELEHGKVNPTTNITNDDPVMTFKIAMAHLMEDGLYYSKLASVMKD